MNGESQADLFVGVDWATQKHDVCLVDANGKVRGERCFKNGGEGLAALVSWLLEHADGAAHRLAVAIEVPHGPVVETLLECGLSVFTINPKQLDRFRDRYALAGVKDDRLDAKVLAQSLRTDGPSYRLVDATSPTTIRLRECSRIHDELQQSRRALCNRLDAQLRRYYPQFLDVTNDAAADWSLELWALVPTPEKAKKTRPKAVETLLKKYRIRRVTATQVLKTLREKPVTVAPGTTEAATDHIELLVAQLSLVNAQLKRTHQRLEACLKAFAEEATPGQSDEQRDVEILSSLPGVGSIVLATLLSEASRPIASRDYHAIRAFAGIAPVTRRSGKTHQVSMRRACNPRVRQALYHWARVASQHDPTSKQRYAALRGRGHSHGRALRTVGDRLLKVACAMLDSQKLFEKTTQIRKNKLAER